jgi:hypothetical protein
MSWWSTKYGSNEFMFRERDGNDAIADVKLGDYSGWILSSFTGLALPLFSVLVFFIFLFFCSVSSFKTSC